MKILLISDEECKALWDYWQPDRLNGAELILSCGDLKPAYLEFLVTMGHVPLLYVPGNHDKAYELTPPGGCECLDDQLIRVGDLRIMGFGGSMRYNPGPFQYTEKEMARRIHKMRWKLRKAGGVDIVVTHAPMSGFGDAPDPCHRGFECFRELVDKYHPRYFIHGHVHRNYGNVPRCTEYNGTQIINAYERYFIDV